MRAVRRPTASPCDGDHDYGIEIMRFDKATMVRALHDEPKFSELFISHLTRSECPRWADLVDQLFNSSEKRLARLLLLANFGKEGRPEPVIAKVSQETRRDDQRDRSR